MLKKAKGQGGITLVALVVTIIVLLILAGVAISLTLGPNGIFNRAQNAANTWGNATRNESTEMNSFENTSDNVVDRYWPDGD